MAVTKLEAELRATQARVDQCERYWRRSLHPARGGRRECKHLRTIDRTPPPATWTALPLSEPPPCGGGEMALAGG